MIVETDVLAGYPLEPDVFAGRGYDLSEERLRVAEDAGVRHHDSAGIRAVAPGRRADG